MNFCNGGGGDVVGWAGRGMEGQIKTSPLLQFYMTYWDNWFLLSAIMSAVNHPIMTYPLWGYKFQSSGRQWTPSDARCPHKTASCQKRQLQKCHLGSDWLASASPGKMNVWKGSWIHKEIPTRKKEVFTDISREEIITQKRREQEAFYCWPLSFFFNAWG